jgi:hypothetical protein
MLLFATAAMCKLSLTRQYRNIASLKLWIFDFRQAKRDSKIQMLEVGDFQKKIINGRTGIKVASI